MEQVQKRLDAAGIDNGASGPRLRTTTSCPGTNWCKRGLIDPFKFVKLIEEKLNIRCGMDLPHKFKIVVSGCPNACTRADCSEIGIHGQVDFSHPDKRIGYAIFIGGCGGKSPRLGFKLERVFAQDDVLGIVGRVIDFYRYHAKPRQRLAFLIDVYGKERFLKEVVYANKL